MDSIKPSENGIVADKPTASAVELAEALRQGLEVRLFQHQTTQPGRGPVAATSIAPKPGLGMRFLRVIIRPGILASFRRLYGVFLSPWLAAQAEQTWVLSRRIELLEAKIHALEQVISALNANLTGKSRP